MVDTNQPFRVFINYRRSDSGGYAGRIYDALTAHSDEWSIFMDIDAIDPGADFTEVIDESLETCDAVVAVIGRSWLQSEDSRGRRRLEHPDDFVRLELLAALDRKVRVIPVLVQGAEMPSSEDLPEALVTLARRQGLELSDGRWRYDMGRLIEVLDNYHRGATQPLPVQAPEPEPEPEPEPPQNEPEPEPAAAQRPPEPAPAQAVAVAQPAEASVAPAATIAALGAAAVFVANFVSVLPHGGGTLVKPLEVPLSSYIWFSIEFVAVPILAALAILAGVTHRIRGELAVGMLLGFGLACCLAGVGFVGFFFRWGHSTAGWILVVGGVLLAAGGAVGLWSHRQALVQDRDVSSSQGRGARVAVAVGSVLCVAATIVPVTPGYRLLSGHQAWFALEALLGGVAALVCLIPRGSPGMRLVGAGVQFAIGIQLALHFLGFVGQNFSKFAPTPQAGAYLGFVGGIVLAAGGYLAARQGTAAEATPARAAAAS